MPGLCVCIYTHKQFIIIITLTHAVLGDCCLTYVELWCVLCLQQKDEQLVYKARQLGQLPASSPPRQPKLKFSGPPHKLYDEDTSPPPPPRRQPPHDPRGQGQVVNEPKVSPGRSEVNQRPQQRQKPIYLENGDDRRADDRRADEDRLFYKRDTARDVERGRRDDEYTRGRDQREVNRGRDERDQYQGYNDQRRSPPPEVRKSRSLSPPPGKGQGQKSHQEILNDLEKVPAV